MPIYEYLCSDCGQTSEILTVGSGPGEAVRCAACGSRALVKKVTAAAIPKMPSRPAGRTCCGRDEQCDSAGSCCCMH